MQHKSSMPLICLLSITCGGWRERHKSPSAANRATLWWAYPLRPRTPTGWHKSTSAANLLEPWSSPSGQTERHKSSKPLLSWSSLGYTRTLGRAAGRCRSARAANLRQSQRPKEALTVMHKTPMWLICWGFFGQRHSLRDLTGRHKSTSVAYLSGPWCPQVGLTERHKPSMPPICWSPPGLFETLRSATVKWKSVKAADLLQSRWSPALPTVQRKSRGAAKRSVGAGVLSYSFLSFSGKFVFGYGASDVRPRTGCQSHRVWSGWPGGKMPHCRLALSWPAKGNRQLLSTTQNSATTRNKPKHASRSEMGTRGMSLDRWTRCM